MSEFATFDLTLTRAELGLGLLHVNDMINYRIGEQIMGGQQTWNRQTAKSPFVDGEYTVHRSMANRQETVQVQVLGADQPSLQTNIGDLLDAASQFTFDMTMTMDGTTRVWHCQTADYTVDWSGPRWMAAQVLVTLSIPTLPGVFGA